jgi:hypothetical protein
MLDTKEMEEIIDHAQEKDSQKDTSQNTNQKKY